MSTKQGICCAFALVLVFPSLRADIIAQWNFNSLTPDSSTATGAISPSFGDGAALLVGGVSASFAAGCTNDTAAADNSGWNTASYPTQGVSNKTAGVQFNISTSGYTDITVRWDHKVSASASKYCRLQYSANGTDFTDFPTPIAAAAVSTKSSYFETQTISLAGLPGADDNPNFAFRIVSEFESTATGAGAEGYVTTLATNTYSRSGTIRFDMVTLSGSLIPGVNTAPHISVLSDQVLRPGQSTGPLAFTIADAEDAPDILLLQPSSSELSVVPQANIILDGMDAERTITVTAQRPGVSIITLVVIDSGGRSNHTSFIVTVLPANTAPLLSAFAWTNTVLDTACPPLTFTISDLETPAHDLSVSGFSANPLLVPNDPAHLTFGGSGSNRTLTLTPAPGQSGVAPITVTVSDGSNVVNSLFALVVRPSPSVALYEPFDYPDGSLRTNSGCLWSTRSGTAGQCQVTNHRLQITASQSEDVVAPLAGGPYLKTNGLVLYAGFRVTFLALPKALPSYFAHFGSGTSLRGRIYAGTTNAAPGCFQLLVANGSDAATALPQDLTTNTSYCVVSRYDLDSATASLWVNPLAETDACATATDPQTAVSISAYGFRQDSSLGTTALVSDLQVGLTFEAVCPRPVVDPVPLSLECSGQQITVRWTYPGLALQSAPTPAGPFTNVPNATSPLILPRTDSAQFFRLSGGTSGAIMPNEECGRYWRFERPE